jgi:hypothetical protein
MRVKYAPVEVSVVRVDPGKQPRLVFDTRVNPERRMAATEIHGIRDRDVLGSPMFEDVAGGLLHALSGCARTSDCDEVLAEERREVLLAVAAGVAGVQDPQVEWRFIRVKQNSSVFWI